MPTSPFSLTTEVQKLNNTCTCHYLFCVICDESNYMYSNHYYLRWSRKLNEKSSCFRCVEDRKFAHQQVYTNDLKILLASPLLVLISEKKARYAFVRIQFMSTATEKEHVLNHPAAELKVYLTFK